MECERRVRSLGLHYSCSPHSPRKILKFYHILSGQTISQEPITLIRRVATPNLRLGELAGELKYFHCTQGLIQALGLHCQISSWSLFGRVCSTRESVNVRSRFDSIGILIFQEAFFGGGSKKTKFHRKDDFRLFVRDENPNKLFLCIFTRNAFYWQQFLEIFSLRMALFCAKFSPCTHFSMSDQLNHVFDVKHVRFASFATFSAKVCIVSRRNHGCTYDYTHI